MVKGNRTRANIWRRAPPRGEHKTAEYLQDIVEAKKQHHGRNEDPELEARGERVQPRGQRTLRFGGRTRLGGGAAIAPVTSTAVIMET